MIGVPTIPDRANSRPRLRRRARYLVTAAVAAACAALCLPSSVGAADAPQPADAPATYTNPVTSGYSIDFPDPSILQGKDGYWYAYSTGGPYDEKGASSDPIKMARSKDLVHWTKLGAVFTAGKNWPTWAAPTTGFWAPDIRFVDGKYVLYFVAPDTTFSSEGFDPGIGTATAPTPAGPWTPSAQPLLAPVKNPNGVGYQTVIDPAQFTDTDGQRYLYFGSYGTGVRVVKLSDDGMSAVGSPRQVTTTRFEGPFVIHRDGWYYLLGSSANCCAGPTTGYAVFAGRSRSPYGPFRDAEGQSMAASRTGGTIVVAPNGNRWIGTGHNTVVTDLSGQTWMAYHAVDKNDPYLDVSPGFTMRPMLLDRLDWVHGWPTVRGGQWASDGPVTAPVTTGAVNENFSSGTTLHATSGSLSVQPDDPASDAGGFARLSGSDAVAVSTASVPADTHTQADVRAASGGSVGVVTRYAGGNTGIRTRVDEHTLSVTVSSRGRTSTHRTTLPADFDLSVWHKLAVDVRGRTVTAQVSDGGLGDPYGTVTAPAPAPGKAGSAGVTGSGQADVDNLSVARLYRPHGKTARDPRTGSLQKAYSDEFTGGLGSGWTWLRRDDAAVVKNGRLTWPTEQTDLSGATAGQAGVLLRDQPSGNFVVETKLNIDTGVTVNRNYQQGGIVVYLADNFFLRLDVAAVGETRIVEFGKRMTASGVDSWGGSIIGPPAATTWLRLAHTVDPKTGEHLYRAGSSRDGRHWIWGTTWTLPAGSQPRIGLVSQGSTAAAEAAYGKATSKFDYFRVYRTAG